MNALVMHIARPVTLWALHFIAIYALISAACAPRDLMEVDAMRLIAVIVTAGAALLVLFWLLRGLRAGYAREPDEPDAPLIAAANWSAFISLVAILANLWPVAFLTSCTG